MSFRFHLATTSCGRTSWQRLRQQQAFGNSPLQMAKDAIHLLIFDFLQQLLDELTGETSAIWYSNQHDLFLTLCFRIGLLQ